MLKGMFLSSDEIIEIIKDMIEQQKIITEIFEKVNRCDERIDISIECESAKVLSDKIVQFFC